MRAAIYCRISPKPGDAEASVERQEADSRQVCARNGWAVTHLFTDLRRSAWQRNRSRPGWDSLLVAIRNREVDVIVIWHPDRLMRQPWDFEELLHACGEHGIQLYGQAGGRDLSNPDDVFILRIEVAHACRSSDDTSRRVRRALEEQAAEGRPHGGARPYGYRQVPGGLVVDAVQAAHVRWMVEQFLSGRSVNSLVNDLNSRRVPSKTGLRWSNQAVRRVLTGPAIAGLRSHKGSLSPAVWEPIITAGERDEILRLMTTVRQPRKYGDREYLLRGLVRCGLCAAKMQGMFTGTAHYRCPSPALGGCGKVKVVAGPVEHLIDVWCRRELADLTLTTAEPHPDDGPSEDDRDRALLNDLAAQLGNLELTMDEFRAARAPIVQRRKDRARQQHARPTAQMAGVGPVALLEAWDDPERVTPDMRRATYLTLLDAVFIDPIAVRTGPRFQPERVRPLRAGASSP